MPQSQGVALKSLHLQGANICLISWVECYTEKNSNIVVGISSKHSQVLKVKILLGSIILNSVAFFCSFC